jgi:hypothetical protein
MNAVTCGASIRARCPRLSGRKSGSLTNETYVRVGSTLDADCGPPVRPTPILAGNQQRLQWAIAFVAHFAVADDIPMKMNFCTRRFSGLSGVTSVT